MNHALQVLSQRGPQIIKIQYRIKSLRLIKTVSSTERHLWIPKYKPKRSPQYTVEVRSVNEGRGTI